MRRRAKQFLQRALGETAGASAIEFAIIAPLFFTLIFGIIVYGYYFASLSVVNHVAYEAARASISGLTDDERSTLAHARADQLIGALGAFLDPAAVTVQTTASGSGLYSVTVDYQFNALKLIGATSLFPMPPTHQIATVEVSHGGY